MLLSTLTLVYFYHLLSGPGKHPLLVSMGLIHPKENIEVPNPIFLFV